MDPYRSPALTVTATTYAIVYLLERSVRTVSEVIKKLAGLSPTDITI